MQPIAVATSLLLLVVLMSTSLLSLASARVADPPTHPRTGSKPYPPASTRQHEDGPRPPLSKRVRDTEPAHIEAVLSRYADMDPSPANLAQGVAHWNPPPAAMRQIERGGQGGGRLTDSANHRYGPALGLPALREALREKLVHENGLDMAGQEVRTLIQQTGRLTSCVVCVAIAL